MAYVWASFEQLAVRGETGLAWDEAAASSALAGSTYSSAIIKLTAKLDASLLLLSRHVTLEEFSVDIVVAREEEEEEEGGGGVLSFIQERIVGSKKQTNRYSKVKNRSGDALASAWEACKAKGYHGLYALAKVTPATLPDNPCRQRYTPGHYAEALLNGCRAYFMFQQHNTLFEADALGLWVGGGGGCVAAVDVCYLVLAWRLNEQETRGIAIPSLSLLNTTTTFAAGHQKQGCKRAAVRQSADGSPLTPARKRLRVSAKAPPQPPPEAASTQQEEEEEEEEEEEVTVKKKRTQREKIPEVWYSPDIAAAAQQQATPPRPPPKLASPVHLSPASPASHPPSPSRTANHPPSPSRTSSNLPSPSKTASNLPSPSRTASNLPSPSRTASHPPSPQKLASQLLSPQKPAQETEDDLSDLTLGFERSTPRRRGQGRKSTTTPRKSVLLPQWSDEEREELLQFFDTLNPSQSEQTCIALTCKFATMRFGRDLPSKQLYQWVQWKDRTVHPSPDAYTLPGGKEGAHVAAAELFRSLNPEVSESKRVAFTCRFMQTQYGAEINSKELYNILSGARKKRGGRAH